MIQEYQLRILPETAANEQRLKEYLIQEKGLNVRNITATRILKRSIDARQRTIFVNLTVRVYLNEMPKEGEYRETIYNNVSDKPQVVVVGAGPGGLFAALRLIELGLRPVIVERGKNVRDRKKDLALIGREQTVNPESNYSFGEGGRGSLLGRQALHPQQETGKCRQNTERILPAWRLAFHPCRRPSPHRDRQAAAGHRKYAEHHYRLWRRSAL